MQVSETVFISLEQGDTLHMEQVEGRGPGQATTVKRVTFCVLLINIETIPSFQMKMFLLPSVPSPRLSPYHFTKVDKTLIEEIENINESPIVIMSPRNTP